MIVLTHPPVHPFVPPPEPSQSMQREALEEARTAEIMHLRLQLNSAWAEAEALRGDAKAAAAAAEAAQERVRAAAQVAAEKDAELEKQRQWARDALRLRGLAFDKIQAQEAKVSGLEAALRATQASLTTARSELGAAQALNASLRSSGAAAAAQALQQLDAIEADVAAKEREVAAAAQAKAAAEAELAAARAEIARRAQELCAKDARIASLEASAEVTAAVVAELKEMAADAQRMAAEAEKALAEGVEAAVGVAAAEGAAAAEARAEAAAAEVRRGGVSLLTPHLLSSLQLRLVFEPHVYDNSPRASSSSFPSQARVAQSEQALAAANADLAAARAEAAEATAAANSAVFAAAHLGNHIEELLKKAEGAAQVRQLSFQRIRELHREVDFARADAAVHRERADEAERLAQDLGKQARERGQRVLESRGAEAQARAEACAARAESADASARAEVLRSYLNKSIGRLAAMEGELAMADERHAELSAALVALAERSADVEEASEVALEASAAAAAAAAEHAGELEVRLREAEAKLDGAIRVRGLSFEKIRDLSEAVKQAEGRAAAAEERLATLGATVLALRGSLEQAAALSGAQSADLKSKLAKAEEQKAEAQAEASLARAGLMGARRWLKDNETALARERAAKERLSQEIDGLRVELSQAKQEAAASREAADAAAALAAARAEEHARAAAEAESHRAAFSAEAAAAREAAANELSSFKEQSVRLRDACFAKIRSLTDTLESNKAALAASEAEAEALRTELAAAQQQAGDSEALAQGLQLSLHATFEAQRRLEAAVVSVEADRRAAEAAAAVNLSVCQQLAIKVQELEVRDVNPGKTHCARDASTVANHSPFHAGGFDLPQGT